MLKNKDELRKWAKTELDNCIKFWLEHGLDRKYGGMYTCLDKEGKVFSTDKSIWMQGRAAWTFAALCNQYGVKDEWLEASKSCLDFLEKYGKNHAASERFYFTVTEDGRPLRQRRYYFSEGFYVLANAEYYGVTKDRLALERAREVYDKIWELDHGAKDPVNMPPKVEPSTRKSRSLAAPMIYLNLTSTLYKYDEEKRELYRERAAKCREEILLHHKPELAVTLETVAPDGSCQLDTTAGRVVNPGHDMECAWFLLEYSEISSEFKEENLELAERIYEFAYAKGWDNEFSGLLYFVDALGFPPEAYEHDMKLWWPHNELLIASLMLYKLTGKERYAEVFSETQQYCDKYFSDKEYGEWWGYLRRDNKPTLPACKGSTFKGPFHVPRCLMILDKLLQD